MDTPILIAHRGGSLEVPENTMAAFRHAIDIGMRFVELDVQMSSDGELLVMHDERLDRTTNGTGLLHDYTFEQLRRLDAGSKFDPRFAGERIPALREVLDLCVDHGVGVVVELKAPDINAGVEEKVASILGEMWLRGAENIWCISFHHETIKKMRRLDAALPLGYLYEPHAPSFVQPDDTVQAYCPYFKTAVANPDQVKRAHELGKFVFVYTVDTTEDMRAVAAAGIDGMVTDRPTLALEVFRRS